MGGVFGETGIRDGSMNWFVGDEAASTASYFIGWMASGVVIAGDVRDTVETIYQWDALGTGLNIAALLPVFGDGEKVVKNSAKHVLKYPEKGAELGKNMAKYGALDAMPNEGVKVTLINLYWKDAGTQFIKEGVVVDDLIYVAKKGSLEKTLQVVKWSDGLVVWLEEGRLVSGKVDPWVKDVGGSGWEHIRHNHCIDTKPGGSDYEGKFGPEYADENKVRELISNGAKYGQKVDTDIYHYVEPQSGKTLELIIGNNGYIVTAYPV